ncbi:hypothetical protein F4678DRAFT_480640 [Xylaria arbuscula]|nr:hypothetical protein F4678DRAFT_480640 [Xylaria arbuscula]
MACQTRSRAKQQVKQQNIHQSRSNIKRQRAIRTAPGATHGQPLKRAKKRTVRLTASAAISRTRTRTKVLPTLAVQVAQAPTPFKHLPAEIRLMIWKEFVRTPRIIHIDGHNQPTEAARGYTCRFPVAEEFQWDYPEKSEQICPLLGVNRESRYIALMESFIEFGVDYTLSQLRRFQVTNIRRRFSIRAHDIVFFDGDETLCFKNMWTRGDTKSIANIMIKLNVSDINYQNRDARPQWWDMLLAGYSLVESLTNTESLQNVYCLVRNDTASEPQAYHWDKVREFTLQRLDQFPEYTREDLARWLEEFAKPTSSLIYQEQVNQMKHVWKNVSMVG